MSANHTPLPWKTPGTDGGERVISANVRGRERTIAHVYAPYSDYDESGEERDANAAYIVRACNSYPALLSALERLLNGVGVPHYSNCDEVTSHGIKPCDCGIQAARDKARKAIAKARGE